MEHKDADFGFRMVAESQGLGAGTMVRDRDIAEGSRYAAGKREYIGGVVFAAEVAVQAAQFGVGGNQAIEGPAAAKFTLQTAGKAAQSEGAQIRGDSTECNSTAFG